MKENNAHLLFLAGFFKIKLGSECSVNAHEFRNVSEKCYSGNRESAYNIRSIISHALFYLDNYRFFLIMLIC